VNHTLYHCWPYDARISVASCSANSERARALHAGEVKPRERTDEEIRFISGQKARLRSCLTCPGVRALARRGAKPPEVVPFVPGMEARPWPNPTA